LPSNIFVQFLAVPREAGEGIFGLLLKTVAGISLVAGPVALLALFQLQFLPYHNPRLDLRKKEMRFCLGDSRPPFGPLTIRLAPSMPMPKSAM
jgi:hypothetical protein